MAVLNARRFVLVLVPLLCPACDGEQSEVRVATPSYSAHALATLDAGSAQAEPPTLPTDLGTIVPKAAGNGHPSLATEHAPPTLVPLTDAAKAVLEQEGQAVRDSFAQPSVWLQRFSFDSSSHVVVRAEWLGVVGQNSTSSISEWVVTEKLHGQIGDQFELVQDATDGVVPLCTGVHAPAFPVVLLLRSDGSAYRLLDDGMGTVGVLRRNKSGLFKIQNGPSIDLTSFLAEIEVL